MRYAKGIVAPAILAIAAPLAHAADEATDPEAPRKLAPIVVTATRSERSSFEVPVSIDAVDQTQIREARPTVNLSEALSTVPGVVVSNRQNYAQDLQISTRGFGARSTFGVRGVRLIADDIPLTMPDGQGQASTIDLASAKRIEVLRGPYSSIYGNSSGGVIQAFTEDGPEQTTITGSAWLGSFRTNKESLKVGGESGPFNYVASGSRFDTLGYRDHSAATRTQENAKVRYHLDDRADLTIVYNDLRQPFTQDPLGLSRAQFDQNPKQADPNATQFNTRKSIQNSQGGMVYDRHLTEHDDLKLVGYVGTREVVQYLALNQGAQIPVTNSGGVVNLDTHFGGLGLRWVHEGTLRGTPLTLTAGIDYDNEVQTRKGYNDYVGSVLGVQGVLRRNEDDTVYDINQYVQAELKPTEKLGLTLGLRHSEIRFKSEDYYIVPNTTNGNDSGSNHYNNTSPVFGVLYKVAPTVNLYANAGQGFETPTLSELAYRASGAGLNFALQPSLSKSYEAGVKSLLDAQTRLNAAYFYVLTDNEIVPLTNSGGRTTYQNAGKTRRRGFELALDHEFGAGFSGLLAATWLDAEFVKTFRYASTGTTPNRTVTAGNALPGVPVNEVHGELAWRSGNFTTALEMVYNDRLFVDDINSQAAPSYVVFNLRASWKQVVGHWQFEEFGRVDNIADRVYVGSVIVNESNGRFYESAPGRNYLLGVRAAYKF